jgi:transglutaminase-like putative cysteine protease
MKLRVGYELLYAFPQPTPAILMLNIHFTRVAGLAAPDHILIKPVVPISGYRDSFGNWCCRIMAPAGKVRITADAIITDSGLPDPVVADAQQIPVENLPEEALVFLLASRFCDSDQLLDLAWKLFGHARPGWGRVQAICDWVHQHIAIAFCRALNIPARYCTGYLGDVGMPPPYPPGDFAAWFEAYIGGQWYTFDPRNNVPRIGRVLIARGRDAADVAMTTTFGPNTLEGFKVWTDEIAEAGSRLN